MADRSLVIDSGMWRPVDTAIDGMGRSAFTSPEEMADDGFIHQIKTVAFEIGGRRGGSRDVSRYPVTSWSVLMHMVENDLIAGDIAKAQDRRGIYFGFTDEVDQVTYALLAQEPSLERDDWVD